MTTTLSEFPSHFLGHLIRCLVASAASAALTRQTPVHRPPVQPTAFFFFVITRVGLAHDEPAVAWLWLSLLLLLVMVVCGGVGGGVGGGGRKLVIVMVATKTTRRGSGDALSQEVLFSLSHGSVSHVHG